MKYTKINNLWLPEQERSKPSDSSRMYLAFFLTLIFLLTGGIPSFFNLPGLEARFTGIETTALVSTGFPCDSYRGTTYHITYIFVDRRGETQQITNQSICTDGMYDGERVTIWYQPDDPSHMISANDLNFDAIFFAVFSLCSLSALWIGIVLLSRHLRR